MSSIAIKIDPEKMANPDADLRYVIPERIEEATQKSVTEDGFDYLDDNTMVIFLTTEKPEEGVRAILELLGNEEVLDNKILETAIIGVDLGEGYSVVYPVGFRETVKFE